MPTYSVRLDASQLTIEHYTNSDGLPSVRGGAELGQALLEQVFPTVRGQAGTVVGTKGSTLGRSASSVEFFETISGAPKGSTDYDTARRNFQRFNKDGRTPKIETINKYRQNYQAKTGHSSPILDNILQAAGGKVPTEPTERTLPPGKINVQVYGRIDAYAGSGDVRDRPVNGSIDVDQIDDPIAAWEDDFRAALTDEITERIDWVEITYIPAARPKGR